MNNNNARSNIPVLKRNVGIWTFELRPFNYTENDDSKDVFNPFFLDDISMTFSKIPAIYISNGELQAKNLRNKKSFDISKSIQCPYAPKRQ